jgi:hypothetical protein
MASVWRVVRWQQFTLAAGDKPSQYVVRAITERRSPFFGACELRADVMIVDDRPVIVGIAASKWPDVRTGVSPLSLREFRRLPIATFMEAAREAVTWSRDEEEGRASGHDFGARIRRARAPRVKSGHKTEAQWRAIAAAYLDEVRRGTPNPSAALAHRMGVDPATMRVWLHRLRKRGLLPSNENRGKR